MRYSFSSFGMILVGLIAFVIVITFQRVTINNEGDYYSLKEAMEASLFESIDIPYYRDAETGGTIKIVEEKFIENFTRRFIKNTVGNSNGYVLEFYDIMESPPKASVIIKNKTESMTFSDEDFDVVNKLTGILVSKDEETSCTTELSDAYYYSYVVRDNSGVATNKNESNLKGAGEILRAYSAINSDKYTYTYEQNGDPEFYFYNVCSDCSNKSLKENDTCYATSHSYRQEDTAYRTLSNYYASFVSADKNICAYPLFKSGKNYLYPGCREKLFNNNFGTVTDDTLQLVNADEFINDEKNSKYIARDATEGYFSGEDWKWTFKKASEVEDLIDGKDYISFASDGVLNKDDPRADNLYFISWSVPIKYVPFDTSNQKKVGGECNGYATDGIMLIFKVTWKVTKCLK